MARARCLRCGGRTWNEDGRCRDCDSFPTLGYQMAELVQEKCVIPDGDLVGQPYVLTDEMLRFYLNFYRVDPIKGERFYYRRGAQLRRPQKWGKGPFAAAVVIAECHPDAPARPDGFDADGFPVGRPWATPHWQITAVSEGQTDNVWRALQSMIERGSLYAEIPDTGTTRINLPGGGLIEPVTSSAQSRLGQRITGAVQDQTESWTDSNGGRKVADTQRRNLAGMGGRFLETPNAWDPAESSVAQGSFEDEEPGVYFDYVEPGTGSIRNKNERRQMLRKVYGDSWWVDLDRIEDEIVALLKRDPAQAERWFLNRNEASEGRAYDIEAYKALAAAVESAAGNLITIGVDGARFFDALGIVATDVRLAHQWPLGCWEKPEDASHDYEHPLHEIDGAMVDAFERFDPWRVYVDPHRIEYLLQLWQGRWGEKRVIPWRTDRPAPMGWAVRNHIEAVAAGDLSHDGHEDLLRHIGNARRKQLNVKDDKGEFLFTLAKDRPDSPHKIDLAAASVLSWEARGDAIAAGAKKTRKRSRVPVFVH